MGWVARLGRRATGNIQNLESGCPGEEGKESLVCDGSAAVAKDQGAVPVGVKWGGGEVREGSGGVGVGVGLV